MDSNFVQPTTIAALQLKYDYDQLDLDAAITTRSAAIEIKTHAERAKSSMIFIGKLLADVKALLPHGQFEDWCSVEFEMSQRTAQRMMAAAEVFGDKSDTVSLLSDSAMYMLSAPSVPEAARVEVIEQAQETGTSPTKTEVQAVIDKHKPDEELRSKCHKIEFWLMGKGWSSFGYRRDDGKRISGVQKGEHKFSWLNDDWPDIYEKVKAAEKIERAALAAFIKLTPPKGDTVSPLSEEPSSALLSPDETKALIWRVLRKNGPAKDADISPDECRGWLYRNGKPEDYAGEVPAGRSIDRYTFNVAINEVRTSLSTDFKPTTAIAQPPKPEPQPDRPATPETEEERSNRIRQKLRDDMDGYLARKFAAGSPQPDRPLPGWVTGEPDQPAEPKTKPTAIVLELPPIPFPDKDLLIGQVKRAVGILNEEGFATAADLLRVAGRCAYDAQEAASLPVDVEPVVTAKVRTANGEGEVGREFLINLTIGSFKVALDSLGDYGRLTGHFTDIPQAQRILEKIIKNLQDNLT